MSFDFPVKDQWTSYNYEVGAKRMSEASEDKFKFLKMLDVQCPGMPLIINFCEQMEYCETHPMSAIYKLWVTGPNGLNKELKLIPKEKTLEFATKSIKEYGREYAEKVLSATETGSLYYHMLHYYGSYDNLVEEMDNRETNKQKVASNSDKSYFF